MSADPLQTLRQALEAHGCHPRGQEHQFCARCPAHQDRNPSLSVKEGDDGRVLLHCHAGCDSAEIVGAVGLRLADLFVSKQAAQEHETVYDYMDEEGQLLFQVVRRPGKKFAQRRPDPEAPGRFSWKLGDTRRVLYRLDRLIAEREARPTVYICEGEKDVLALERAGALATCNPGGAGKWRPEYAEQLAGLAEAIVVADRDEPGRKHARAVADSLEGRVGAVKIVEAAAGKDAADHLSAGHGLDAFVPVEAPTLGTVDLGQALSDVESFVRRFVVMTDDQALAVALWVLHTHAFEASDYTPYLFVTSAERESGKSRLKEVVEVLIPSPIPTSNVSPAAVFRIAGDDPRPTFLIDEVDEIFAPKSERSELRGLLNSGFHRGDFAIRMVGEGSRQEPRRFAVYCPKLLVGKNSAALGDTLESRCVRIELKRKTREEYAERFRRRDVQEQALGLSQALALLADHHSSGLAEARPSLPDALSDRQQDVWEPLLAIADIAGGAWPRRARKAAIALSATRSEDVSLGVQLLWLIHAAFDEPGREERITTADLIASVSNADESPFADWWNDKDFKPEKNAAQQLGKRLKRYGIKARELKFDGRNLRGFERDWFEDAWARFPAPSPDESATPLPPAPEAAHDPLPTALRSGALFATADATSEQSVAPTDPLRSRIGSGSDPASEAAGSGGSGVSGGRPKTTTEETSTERLLQFSDASIDEALLSVSARHPSQFPDGLTEAERRDTARMLIEAELVTEGERPLERRRPGFLAKATKDGLITPVERRRMALLEVACERRTGLRRPTKEATTTRSLPDSRVE